MRYWLDVFPTVRREVTRWERRAIQIPDPSLRGLALEALSAERGNLEGAAAFAAFLPRRHRAAVVRALVAFQAAYDYADALSEQPNPHPASNAHRLHGALLAALSRGQRPYDYYDRLSRTDDGGYLGALIEHCATSLQSLPSYSIIAGLAQAAARRMVLYQSFNLAESQGGRRALERWASAQTHAADLHWWEAAAAAGSSLVVFALIAAAASPNLEGRHARALAYAYFPWIGALHILLDSLVDRAEDAESGYRSFLDYYGSPEKAAHRLHAIATRSARLAAKLPYGEQHSLILTAMVSFYLSATCRDCPYARMARPLLVSAMGTLATPMMLVMVARRSATHLGRSIQPRPRPAPRAPAPDCDGAPLG
jgi:tetraprenyl-beta-curcumene synthase